MPAMLSRLWRLAQVLFLLLALLFIGLLLRSQWQELSRLEWRLRPAWLALSAAFIAISWAMEVAIWRHILGWMGGVLSLRGAARVYFLSALTRYIPGNVWQPLGMTVLARRQGVRAEATVTSIALFQAVNLLTVGVIAAIYFPLSGNLGLLGQLIRLPLAPFLPIAALPVLIFLLRPQWLMNLLNLALRRLGRSPLPVRLTSARLLGVVLFTLVDWLMLGGGFAALTVALTDFSLVDFARLFPHLSGVYPLAYALGYLNFLTPGGLAIREGALYVLLYPILGGGLSTAAALAMRVWLALGELVAAGLSLLIERRAKTDIVSPIPAAPGPGKHPARLLPNPAGQSADEIPEHRRWSLPRR